MGGLFRQPGFSAMRRSLIPLLILVCAYVGLPPLLEKLFPPDLPVAELALHEVAREPAPFTFSDGAGRSLTLEQFRGRHVLVNVWATWCAPCRKEMPSLDRLARRLAGGSLAIVPLSIDELGAAVVRPFYERLGLENLPIYVDPSKKAMQALGVIGIPTTLIIGPDGREIARMTGPAHWDAPATVRRISEIIGAAPGRADAPGP